MQVSFGGAHPKDKDRNEVHYPLMMEIWWSHPNDPSMLHSPAIDSHIDRSNTHLYNCVMCNGQLL